MASYDVSRLIGILDRFEGCIDAFGCRSDFAEIVFYLGLRKVKFYLENKEGSAEIPSHLAPQIMTLDEAYHKAVKLDLAPVICDDYFWELTLDRPESGNTRAVFHIFDSRYSDLITMEFVAPLSEEDFNLIMVTTEHLSHTCDGRDPATSELLGRLELRKGIWTKEMQEWQLYNKFNLYVQICI